MWKTFPQSHESRLGILTTRVDSLPDFGLLLYQAAYVRLPHDLDLLRSEGDSSPVFADRVRRPVSHWQD